MRRTFLKSSLPIVLAATLILEDVGAGAASCAAECGEAVFTGGRACEAVHIQTKAHHRVVRKRHTRASRRNGAKRAAYRPEYTEHSVEVINGSSTKQVVFNEEKKPVGTAKGERRR